jgi:hypothetical protein
LCSPAAAAAADDDDDDGNNLGASFSWKVDTAIFSVMLLFIGSSFCLYL